MASGTGGEDAPQGEARRTPPSAHQTGTYEAVGTAGRSAVDLSRTGYFKPVRQRHKLRQWLDQIGLFVGQRMARAVRDDNIYLILMAAVVGIISGVAAASLLTWIDSANGLFSQVERLTPLGSLVFVGLPMLGGLLVGLLRLVSPQMAVRDGGGLTSVMSAVSTGGGHLNGWAGLALGVGTGLTIGSGGSVGHEGPTVGVGATVGSVVARFFGLRMRRQIAMVGAGAAAGLASAFNAPLAGVIFTVEVVFRRSVGGNVGTMSMFTPLVVAAVAGTFTSHLIFGERTEFTVASTEIATVAEMPFYLLIAALAGLVSVLMSRSIVWTTRGFDHLGIPEWIKPGLGGLGVGLLGAFLFTDLLGPGRATLGSALTNDLVWTVALPLVLLKILATSLTIGSRGMGGLFMPSLFIGACLGTSIHPLAELALPEVGHPAAYALVGMAALLGATLRAPITPIVMIFELTREYEMILPIMFAAILGSFIAGKIQPESHQEQMLRKHGDDASHPLEEGEVMHRGRVGEIMVQPDHLLLADAGFEEVQRAAQVEGVRSLFVVEPVEGDDTPRLVGFIDTAELAARILRNEADTSASARDLMSKERPSLLMRGDTLAGATLALARAHREVLPVVDEDRHLQGLLYRGDVMAHYSRHVLEKRDDGLRLAGAGGLQQEVGLGRGVIVERVMVGRKWAGRSLAQLDLRRRTGVNVVEWRRQERHLPLDPTVPLKEGDLLAITGTRDQFLEMRWIEKSRSGTGSGPYDSVQAEAGASGPGARTKFDPLEEPDPASRTTSGQIGARKQPSPGPYPVLGVDLVDDDD